MYETVPDKIKLTAQQEAVFSRLIQGKSQDEIAHDLGISRRMVNRHIETYRRKTRTKSTIAAVAFAIKQGLL